MVSESGNFVGNILWPSIYDLVYSDLENIFQNNEMFRLLLSSTFTFEENNSLTCYCISFLSFKIMKFKQFCQ